MLSSSSLTGQGSEFDTTSDEFVEGDPVVCAEVFHDDVHGLRAQIITCSETYSDINTSSFSSGAWGRGCGGRTHRCDGLLQLVGLHRPAAVLVVRGERHLPGVQNLRELLELMKAHHTRHIPLKPPSVKVHLC